MKHKKKIPATFPLSCSVVSYPKTFMGYLFHNFWKFFGWIFIWRTIYMNVSSVGYRLFPAVALGMVTGLLAAPGDNFMQQIGVTAVIIIGVYLFFDYLWIHKNIMWARMSPRSRIRITEDLLNYIHCQSSEYINKRMVGKMSEQVNNIADGGLEFLNLILSRMFRLGAVMLIGLAMIFTFHWTVALLVSVALLLNFFWFGMNLKKVHIVGARLAANTSHIHGHITDSIGGAANVRAFSGRLRELSFLSRILRVHYVRFNDMLFAERTWWVPLLLLNTFVTGAVIWLSAYLFYGGYITAAAVVTIITAYVAMDSSMWDFMDEFAAFIRRKARFDRNYKELITRITMRDIDNAPVLKPTNACIEFDAVNFKYDRNSALVLSKFNMSVRPGEHVGIVGASGAGKTTIIKLLMRMYDINAGSIKIDGQEIDKVSMDSLRRNIAFIPQDTALFNRSILDNIKYANPRASMEEVIAAAKFAEAHDFISKLSNGYHAMVGDRGIKLSGGQRQRIAIARAFLQHAPILLIDEATSALDSDTEHLIQNAIGKIADGKTMLVVAHRLSTLAALDRIIVMKGGRIAEQGTHKQLIKKPNGIYARKFKRQSCGFLG